MGFRSNGVRAVGYSKSELDEILDSHAQWLVNNGNGRRANFFGENLVGHDLSGRNLSNIDFNGCDLTDANLFGANLSHANFKFADLNRAKGIATYHQGKHVALYTFGENIFIGCHSETIEWWLKEYIVVGAMNGYSQLEIQGYYGFIMTCCALRETIKGIQSIYGTQSINNLD